MNQQKNPKEHLLFIGTYTRDQSKGIYYTAFNPERGTLSQPKLAAESSNPSYLAIDPDQQMVYAANENDSGMVSTFKWDTNQQLLKLVDQKPSFGAYPCYIDVNPIGSKLAVANYGRGNVAFYDIKNGLPIGAGTVRQHSGHGPNQRRQEGPHAHFSKFIQAYHLIYTVDLGIDQVIAYPINEQGDVGEGFTAFQLEGGAGPRHLTFHPQKNLVFIINELSSTIVSARVNQETGKFTEVDQVSTLPTDFEGENSCADIHINMNGKYLYGSNRGHNSIAIFSIAEEGKLQLKGTEPVRGDWPRNFTLSPDGQFLLVANQRSNNIVVFRIDQQTGMLNFNQSEIPVDSPVCLKFY